MPSITTVDRTGPNLELVGPVAINTSPNFPFRYYYNNGYFPLDGVSAGPKVTPSIRAEVHVKGITHKDQIIAWTANGIVVTVGKIYYFGSEGWDNPPSVEETRPDFDINPQLTYVFRFGFSNADTLTVRLYQLGAGSISTIVATSTNMVQSEPALLFGMLGSTEMADITSQGISFQDSSSIVVLKTQAERVAPSNLTLSPSIVPLNAAPGTYVGTLSATLADLDNGPVVFRAVNAETQEVIRNGKVYVGPEPGGAVDVGQHSIQVRMTDNIGYSASEQVLWTVLPLTSNAPTDIAFVEDTVNQPDEEQSWYVTSFTVTDADAGDTHTLALVTGTGDTDNDKFTITGGDLFTDGVIGVGTYSIRVQATDLHGLTFAKALTMTIVDTSPPSMTMFDIPSTGTSYNVTPTAGQASDNIQVSHFKITETDVQPAFDAAGWVQAADFTSTPYTIVTQSGTGSYTLYCWAKDAENNVSTASISDVIELTIA